MVHKDTRQRILITQRLTFLLIMFVAISGMAVDSKPEDQARKSASEWLSEVDHGNYAESWDSAGTYLQHANSKDVWLHKLDSMRKPLGKVVSRSPKSTKQDEGDPFFTTRRFRFEFNSSFANRPKATETITVGLEKSGSWKV